MEDGGKQMSMYGKCEVDPRELDGLWKNVLKRTGAITRKHLATVGNGTKIWTGIKTWSRSEIDSYSTTMYNHRTRPTVADQSTTYDRLFHISYGYNGKMHRDDRNQVKKVGLTVQEEEQDRAIPILSSSNYGHRLDKPLQSFTRKYCRIEHILKGFYYKSGTGLPPCDT